MPLLIVLYSFFSFYLNNNFSDQLLNIYFTIFLLGVGNIKIKERDNNVDLNTLKATQGILVGTANANKPSGESGSLGLVLVLKVAENQNAIWQFYSRWSTSDYLYFRSKTETGWGSWIKLT